MTPETDSCAILADRHPALSEGVRNLLESSFQSVFIVADGRSLRDGAQRLLPALIVLDISLPGIEFTSLLKEIHDLSPGSRMIALSVYDQASVARRALASGVHGVVLKRCIGSDFLTAINTVLHGEEFVSPGFGLTAKVH